MPFLFDDGNLEVGLNGNDNVEDCNWVLIGVQAINNGFSWKPMLVDKADDGRKNILVEFQKRVHI